MDHDIKKLIGHILPKSRAQSFDAACREWDLVGIEVSEDFDNCPCGQQIKEHCFIENRVTEYSTEEIQRFQAIVDNAAESVVIAADSSRVSTMGEGFDRFPVFEIPISRST
jgi:hypothetical protein